MTDKWILKHPVFEIFLPKGVVCCGFIYIFAVPDKYLLVFGNTTSLGEFLYDRIQDLYDCSVFK